MLVVGLAMLIVVIMLTLSVPVMYSFITAVFILVYHLKLDPSFMLPYGFDVLNAVVMLCVPLYILVGNIMQKSAIGEALVDFIDLFVGNIRGGLGVVSVYSSAVFGAISGSCNATLVCIGSVMLPKMYDQGYPKGHAAALITNAAPLGLLIPPSSTMIIYAWVARQSILACFLATVLPGLFLATTLSITNLVMLRNNTNIQLVEKKYGRERWDEIKTKTKWGTPALLMPIIVLGGTYSGIFTPTESAAIAVFYAIPVGFLFYKKLTLRFLMEALLDAAETTGSVLVMSFGIMILSRLLIMQELPELMMGVLKSISKDPRVILLIINLMLLGLGMIMDDLSAMLLSVPILVPVVASFGVHPVHLAAIVGVNLGLGVITPPCAPLLYLGSRVSGVSALEMLPPTMWFILFAWFPTLIAVTYFPELSLWLPKLVLGTV